MRRLPSLQLASFVAPQRVKIMKGKRRHELQQNMLADWLGQKIDGIRPYLNWIIAGVVIAVVGVISYAIWSGVYSSQSSDPWEAYASVAQGPVLNPEGLKKVGEAYGDTQAGLWAQKMEADTYSGDGSAGLLIDREAAIEQLNRAQKIYERIIPQADSYPMLQRRARYSLAQTYESLGELAKAKEHYEQVAKDSGDPLLQQLAERALARLDDPDAPEFYAEVAAYVSPSSPDYDPSLDVLPERHDISYPGGRFAAIGDGSSNTGNDAGKPNTRDFDPNESGGGEGTDTPDLPLTPPDKPESGDKPDSGDTPKPVDKPDDKETPDGKPTAPPKDEAKPSAGDESKENKPADQPAESKPTAKDGGS